MIVLVTALLALSAPDAAGDDSGAPAVIPPLREKVEEPPHTWIGLRGGLTNDPTLFHACGEVAPLEGTLRIAGVDWHTGVSVEGCGNGTGFLFPVAVPELAHFRAKWKLTAFQTEWGWFEPLLSGGFAELQTSGDTPGFTFVGTAPGGASTSGPELGTSLRYKLALGWGFEAMAEAGLAVAYLAYAPQLSTPQDPFQASLSFTAGVGW